MHTRDVEAHLKRLGEALQYAQVTQPVENILREIQQDLADSPVPTGAEHRRVIRSVGLIEAAEDVVGANIGIGGGYCMVPKDTWKSAVAVAKDYLKLRGDR